MADRENEKKYSAETKGYTDKIYEVRFMPVLERSEYQAGPEREGLIKLQGIMEEKDLTGEKLCQKVEEIFSRPGGAEALGRNAKKMAILDANERIYQVIKEVLS